MNNNIKKQLYVSLLKIHIARHAKLKLKIVLENLGESSRTFWLRSPTINFSNNPVVIANVVKGDVVSKDPNAVKYGLHEVACYSGSLAEVEGQRKKKTIKVLGGNRLIKKSVREGANRAYTLLTLI